MPLLTPFQILVKLIDDENKELYLLGDLNANMLENSNNATKHLNAIMELYHLTQTISSPTRVTMASSSLLDVCITPTPEKLVTSRVVPIAISDRYLILNLIFILIKSATRKLKFKISNMFNAENFINDLQDEGWDLCDGDFSVDKKWETWKLENAFFKIFRQTCTYQNQKHKKRVQCTFAY